MFGTSFLCWRMIFSWFLVSINMRRVFFAAVVFFGSRLLCQSFRRPSFGTDSILDSRIRVGHVGIGVSNCQQCIPQNPGLLHHICMAQLSQNRLQSSICKEQSWACLQSASRKGAVKESTTKCSQRGAGAFRILAQLAIHPETQTYTLNTYKSATPNFRTNPGNCRHP